jgi:hypothetical protein
VQEHGKAVRAAEREAVRARQVRGHRVVIADDPFGVKPEALERLIDLSVRDAPAQRLSDRRDGPRELTGAVEIAVAAEGAAKAASKTIEVRGEV